MYKGIIYGESTDGITQIKLDFDTEFPDKVILTLKDNKTLTSLKTFENVYSLNKKKDIFWNIYNTNEYLLGYCDELHKIKIHPNTVYKINCFTKENTKNKTCIAYSFKGDFITGNKKINMNFKFEIFMY